MPLIKNGQTFLQEVPATAARLFIASGWTITVGSMDADVIDLDYEEAFISTV
jgi:hypothetical protein